MKLSGCLKNISSYKTHILDFRFRWIKARSILWPLHYKAMGEELNPSYNHQIRSFYHQLSYITLLFIIKVLMLVGDLQRGHLWSTKVTNRFLLIYHYWKKLHTWALCHCDCLVERHWLICGMTFLGNIWPWPEVRYWLWSSMVTIYMSRRVLPRGTRWCPNYASRFLSSKVIRKKTILSKTAIYPFLTPAA